MKTTVSKEKTGDVVPFDVYIVNLDFGETEFKFAIFKGDYERMLQQLNDSK